jgi:hypothetical protein
MQQNPTQSNQKGMVHQGWLNVPNSSHKELVAQRILQHCSSLSLSLSLSHTHTHTHTQLTRVYTNRVGAMPFLFAAKTTFSFSPTMDLSLKSRRINWVPGFFFFQTKENEQQCFIYLFIYLFIYYYYYLNVSNWKTNKSNILNHLQCLNASDKKTSSISMKPDNSM